MTDEEDRYRPVTLPTPDGPADGRLYSARGGRRGALFVGGAGGGWDTPAAGLYPRLCAELPALGIACLRVRFRDSRSLDEAVADVRAGLDLLAAEGVDAAALVGHSFGGAVVVRAAAAEPSLVRTVIALATQSYGAEPASRLGPRCSLLLVHGADDEVLPASASKHVYELALEPRRLVLLDGARHVLDEAADDVHELVRAWILAELP